VLRSPGHPLDSAARAFFEPRFGRDFSDVRMHTNKQAAESAKSIAALAYTVGNNIAFGEDQFAPDSNAGRRLLAHELAHVVQQSKGSNSALVIHRQPLATAPVTTAGATPGGSVPPPSPAESAEAPVPHGEIVKTVDGIQLVEDEEYMD